MRSPLAPVARLEAAYSTLRIYIDDLLHVWLDRERLVGISVWRTPRAYKIEFIVDAERNVLVEYDDRALWESILRQLAEAL